MAQRIGAEHHERLLTIDDLLTFLPPMVRLQDEPIADPVCVPVYYVSELARKNGVTVCQLGEGSDELFCGYPWWRDMLMLQRWDDWPAPRWAKRLGVSAATWLGKGDNWKVEWLRRGAEGLPIFWSGAESFTAAQKAKLLSPRLQERFAGRSSWEALAPLRQRFEAKAWDKSALHWMSYSDLNLRLPELLLMRVDKMSMGVALEGRVPFLDHKFVELALSIPTAVKTRDGNLKHVLKKAVRGLIPDDLIDRKKQGFGVPVHEWFLQRLGDRIRREVMEFCKRTDYLDATAVNQFLDRDQGAQSWYLLNLALWWKEYLA
jgi:asparagine synthase (glutamine-hydrolysing)